MENRNALAIIDAQRKNGSLVFVNDEEIRTQRMFIPQVTVIPAGPGDFHDKPIQGKYMPKSHHVDRIGEGAGIEFVAEHCGTRMEGDSVYVGSAQGRRRQSDGTWRTSSKQEYEFSVNDRAEEDFLKDPDKYKTDIAKRKHVLELKKVARQRASTGARLRVIRELTGIPIAFGPDDVKRALVVSRIALNTDAMLDDPATRHAAIATAIGSTREIFGPGRSEPVAIEAPAEYEVVTDAPPEVIDISGATMVPTDDGFGEPTGLDALVAELEEWATHFAESPRRVSAINSAIESQDEAEILEMIAKCRKAKDEVKA